MNINTEEIGDYIIAALFLVTAVYAYWDAQSFPSSAALWPQLLSGFIIVGAGLLLLRPFLPQPMREYVGEPMEMIDVDEEFKETEGQNGRVSEETVNRPINDTVFTVLAISSYIVIAYLIGLLWATPIFVAGYTLWFRQRWYIVLFLVGLSLAIAYGFNELMFLEIDKGTFFGGI